MNVPTAAISTETILLLPSKIKTNSNYQVRPFQPEHSLAEDERIALLAESLERDGQIDNLLITPDHTLVSGHRRLRAGTLINECRTARGQSLFLLRCAIDYSSPEELRRKAIASNLQRRDASAMDIAYLIVQLRKDYGWYDAPGTRKLASYLGMKPQNVSIYERLLRVNRQLQNQIHEGILTMQSALDILRHAPPEMHAEVVARAAEIQMEQQTHTAINGYQNGTHTAERAARNIETAKAHIEYPAVRESLRQLTAQTVVEKPAHIALNRAELLAAITSFTQGSFPTPARRFASYYTTEFAQGRGSARQLTNLFLAAIKATS